MPDSVDPEHPQQPDPESASEQPVEQDRTGGQHQPWHYRSAQQAEPSRPFGPSAPLRRLWFNAALRIGRSTTVHAIRFDPINEAGDERVAPACHTGHDRPDHSADLHQVRDQAISCRNCLSYPVARADGESYESSDSPASYFAAQDSFRSTGPTSPDSTSCCSHCPACHPYRAGHPATPDLCQRRRPRELTSS